MATKSKNEFYNNVGTRVRTIGVTALQKKGNVTLRIEKKSNIEKKT